MENGSHIEDETKSWSVWNGHFLSGRTRKGGFHDLLKIRPSPSMLLWYCVKMEPTESSETSSATHNDTPCEDQTRRQGCVHVVVMASQWHSSYYCGRKLVENSNTSHIKQVTLHSCKPPATVPPPPYPPLPATLGSSKCPSSCVTGTKKPQIWLPLTPCFAGGGWGGVRIGSQRFFSLPVRSIISMLWSW
jgi:hypothetical protein